MTADAAKEIVDRIRRAPKGSMLCTGCDGIGSVRAVEVYENLPAKFGWVKCSDCGGLAILNHHGEPIEV